MEFDVHKLEKMILALRKNNVKIDFTEEEISFMRNIFNIIIEINVTSKLKNNVNIPLTIPNII